MKSYSLAVCVILAGLFVATDGVQDQLDGQTNSTTTRKHFTYTGPLLPTDWRQVSVVNERATVIFNNGSAYNSPVSELDKRDRILVEKIQNGTVYATPLSSTREKLSQWGSSVSSTLGKFGKSIKDQFDHLVNSTAKKTTADSMQNNVTLPTLVN